MRRSWPVLIALWWICVSACLPAGAESAPLSEEDFLLYGQTVREAVPQAGFFDTAPAQNGGYLLRFKDFALTADREEMTEDTVLSGILMDAVPEDEFVLEDIRGLVPGVTAASVIARYPLDNPSLRGTREEAALCVTGAVPGTAFTGVLTRDGQTLRGAEYRLYVMAPGGVHVYKADYVFDRGVCVSVRIRWVPELISLQAAQTAFGEAADLMRRQEYSAYLTTAEGGKAEPFSREDLIFSGFDFLTLSPTAAQSVLGDAKEDVWLQDGDRWLRTMSWPGISMTFEHGEDRQVIRALSVYMDEDLLEGPRGLMPGAPLDDALARFLYEDGPADGNVRELYRLSEDEYGQMELPAEGLAAVRYLCVAEGRKVLLRLYAESGILRNITLQLVR